MKAPGVSGTPGWKALEDHAASEIQGTHLKDLLQSEARNDHLAVEFEDILLDYSRQRVTPKTMLLLHGSASRMVPWAILLGSYLDV